MVVGVRVVVRGRKRKGLEDRGVGRGLPCQENRAEKKACFYSPFEGGRCPDLPAILSLQFHWQAGGIKRGDEELPAGSLGEI